MYGSTPCPSRPTPPPPHRADVPPRADPRRRDAHSGRHTIGDLIRNLGPFTSADPGTYRCVHSAARWSAARKAAVDWYGPGRREVELVEGTGSWNRDGRGLWLTACGVFAYISWVHWPKRVFAIAAKYPALHPQAYRLALTMIGLSAAGLVRGTVARWLG